MDQLEKVDRRGVEIFIKEELLTYAYGYEPDRNCCDTQPITSAKESSLRTLIQEHDNARPKKM